MKPRYSANETTSRRARALSVALRERDENTSAHCGRVVGLAVELGIEHGLSKAELALLWISAKFHDVGKIGIPDEILLKPGKLSDDEIEIVRTHPARSQRIILAIDLPHVQALGSIVRHHHERYDGAGYPDGLVGDAIPLLSRIIAMADAYDTMASGRVYRDAMSHRQIMELLSLERGHQHDPSLFSAFSSVVERSVYRAVQI